MIKIPHKIPILIDALNNITFCIKKKVKLTNSDWMHRNRHIRHSQATLTADSAAKSTKAMVMVPAISCMVSDSRSPAIQPPTLGDGNLVDMAL
jgi:hypothetical protein